MFRSQGCACRPKAETPPGLTHNTAQAQMLTAKRVLDSVTVATQQLRLMWKRLISAKKKGAFHCCPLPRRQEQPAPPPAVRSARALQALEMQCPHQARTIAEGPCALLHSLISRPEGRLARSPQEPLELVLNAKPGDILPKLPGHPPNPCHAGCGQTGVRVQSSPWAWSYLG